MNMHHVGRRIVALSVSALMLLGALPAQAYADEFAPDEVVVDNSGVLDDDAQSSMQDDAVTLSEPTELSGLSEQAVVEETVAATDGVEVTEPLETSEAAASVRTNDGVALESSQTTLTTQAVKVPKLTGRAQVQSRGWLKNKKGTKITLGTVGKGLRLEAFRINRPKSGLSGSIVYQAHVQSKGWMPERKNGKVAGTVGKGLRVEALKIRLTGKLAKAYDVWYRVHVSGIGWLAWTRNGKAAGSQGFGKQAEAVQVLLVKKGASCPEKNGKVKIAFVKGKGIYKAGLAKVSGNVELDMMVAEFIKNRCGSGKGALREAYEIIATQYPYRHQNPDPQGDWKDWSIPFAKDCYKTGSGNCYHRAALLCWIARGLGYDAKCIVGHVYQHGHFLTPHGWVEINKNGTLYIVDPEMHRAYPSREFFMVTYEGAPTEFVK